MSISSASLRKQLVEEREERGSWRVKKKELLY
jgi:hypothetical protein